MDGFLSSLHSINAGVPQGSVVSPVLFIILINDLLISASSSIHSFADDALVSSSFSFNPNDHASTDIQLHRNISASLLSNGLTVIEKWGKDNLVSFNQSKAKQAVISRKRNQNFPPVLMNGVKLDTSASFTQLGRSLSSNLNWKTHIHSLAKHASQKLGFLARARGFFSSSHLLSIYKSQIHPSLEYCSHVWGGAPKSTLCLLDKVQSKAIRLINDPNLTKSLQPLSKHRLVGDISIYYRYFNGHCSQEIRDIIPVPLRRVRAIRAQLIHTLSKFHCLILELYLTNHHSSQKNATYGTSCLLLAFLSPTACHLSNLRSINLILSLSPLSCSLSSFLLC